MYHNIKSNLFEKAFVKQQNMNNEENNEELNKACPSKFAGISIIPSKPPLRKMKSRAELKTGESIKKVGLFDIVSQYVLTQKYKEDTNNSVKDVEENHRVDEKVNKQIIPLKRLSNKKEKKSIKNELNENEEEQKLTIAELQAMLMEAEKFESQSSRVINQLLWYKVCQASFFSYFLHDSN